ncbi:sigma-70 family RNA polymerase sigma factor [Stenotrophomonas maltophilia]|uniref:RNA polymerase sigma factor n=1 Tax=Stenotrophomonas geniculata TaxID=86188 RepID=UPI001F52D862|nr:sigma-70 family RNA polymerase sigma factor [Stenotrophomonas maltophilia]MCI1088358.1 sigma-70 family RNA polymerase sigma factor [Stenotrophomonas maltophilia]MCI1117590.1 sigma-70 family RNA polymerase sigma factor [Stenotrophomonas maltophilia]
MNRARRSHIPPTEPPDFPREFIEFIRTANPFLHEFFSSKGVNAADTEDLAQDCLERLVRYRKYRTEELRGLLRRIARNRLADFRRSTRPRLECRLAPADVNFEDCIQCADPYRQASTMQLLNSFFQALSALPKCSREVYALNRFAGMSYSQIARHRDVTPKTVEKHISRALRDLREKLKPISFCM